MDREAPKRRPEGKKPAGFHRWRKLTFLHWEVPVEVLRPLVHPRLSIDCFEGRAYVGLVPFTMQDIRFFPLPRWPGMTNFHETNVRTYVHLDGGAPGVWFFSLDAASRQCVLGARVTYHLPYFFADMHLDEDGDRVHYRSERKWPQPSPAHVDVKVHRGESIGSAAPGSFEDFLAERYLLYSQKNDRLYSGQVHHAPYPLRRAELEHLDQDLLERAGIPVSGAPVSVLASDGVDVDVYAIEAV
jgi:uncharacterized protein YqjF (DUF2071 family)